MCVATRDAYACVTRASAVALISPLPLSFDLFLFAQSKSPSVGRSARATLPGETAEVPGRRSTKDGLGILRRVTVH